MHYFSIGNRKLDFLDSSNLRQTFHFLRKMCITFADKGMNDISSFGKESFTVSTNGDSPATSVNKKTEGLSIANSCLENRYPVSFILI